jgi:hypothetical protein
LQPVQLVSMAPVPGEMEKLALEGFADTPPPPHPAISSSAGAKIIGRILKTSRIFQIPEAIVSTASMEKQQRAARLSAKLRE